MTHHKHSSIPLWYLHLTLPTTCRKIKRDAQRASLSKVNATPWTVFSKKKMHQRRWKNMVATNITQAPQPGETRCHPPIHNQKKKKPEFVKFISETPRTWKCCKQHPQHGEIWGEIDTSAKTSKRSIDFQPPSDESKDVKKHIIRSFGTCAQMFGKTLTIWRIGVRSWQIACVPPFTWVKKAQNQENCDESSNSQNTDNYQSCANTSENNALNISVEFYCGTTQTQNPGRLHLCWKNLSDSHWEQKLTCSLTVYCLWETTTSFRIRHRRQNFLVCGDSSSDSPSAWWW